jgi:signal peptidase II
LAPGESTWDIGFFRLLHIQNTGAAFGIFQDHNLVLTVIDIIGACIILFLVLFMYKRLPFLNTLPLKISLALILGGTIGNLIDRLSLGYVTDFIDFSFWATFNIADSSVVVGALLLAYFVIRLSRDSDEVNGKTS